MGIKRPLEEADFPEASFGKPIDYNKKLISCTEDFLITTPRFDSLGGPKSNFCELQFDGQLEDGETYSASAADKEFEASAPLSLVTSSSEEDAGNGDTSFWSYFPGYIDISIPPRRPPEQFDDPYISLLNSSPKKEVPLGPDYQAEVPLWEGANHFTDEREQQLMGTCVIPMPDLNDSTSDGVRVGHGRTVVCSCLDVGSMRCVQQHVKEAREKLLETIGENNFTDLGFCHMGDEVACKWTPGDEHVFHEIVLSNPVSHGRKFWKLLRSAFPSRTKKELVSYYFNVFVLRRRAVQNRSYLLEIDSDDDEEQTCGGGDSYRNESQSLDRDTDDDGDRRGPDGKCFTVGEEEDEDSTVESFGDQDLDTSWMDDFWSEPEKGQDGVEIDGKKGENVRTRDGVA
ncbi:hypothetical protein ACP275_05G005500 [Erythranthe tilingii]